MYELITTISIGLDIIGVWLLCSVLFLSKEEMINATYGHWVACGDSIDEKFEHVKNRPFVKSIMKQKSKAKWGLWIVTFGFLLQIAALLLDQMKGVFK